MIYFLHKSYGDRADLSTLTRESAIFLCTLSKEMLLILCDMESGAGFADYHYFILGSYKSHFNEDDFVNLFNCY